MPDPVLVVAADPHFAKLIERAIAAQGMESITADEAETALMALEFEKPIAVILENDLRDRPGTDLAKEIRGRPEGEALPIILLAGPMMPAAELTPRAVKVGVTCCLDSSTDAGDIARGLRSLLEGDSSVLARLVDGRAGAALEPTQADPAEPRRSARQPDVPETRVRETDDDDLPPMSARGEAPSAGAAAEASIEIEVDDSIITGGRIQAPPEAAKYPPAEPREGTLGPCSFAELLQELRRDHATGVLELSREKVKKSIWLRDGVPVSAKSNAMGETLGAVLVKMGKIDEAQRARSMERMQKEKRRHGEVLVEMGLVTQKDVTSALQAQARAKVINCFAWDDGRYAFKPLDRVSGDQPELKMSFGALIAAGVKQRYDLPRLRKVLLPHIGETPRFQEDAAATLDETKLEGEERKVVEGLKGRRSLAEVLALSDLDELELHRALVTAFFAGVVRFSPEGNVTRQYRLEKEGRGSIPRIGDEPSRLESRLGDAPEEETNVPDPDPGPVARRRTAGGDADGEPTAADPEPEATVPPPEPRADAEVEAKVNAALTRMRAQNHYERLGVATDAQAPAVKAAYLRLAKEYHPDRLVQDGGAGIKAKADELFAMISEAYHTLQDETRRKKYDDEVLRGIKDDASDEANAILNAEHQFLKGERLLKAGNIAKAHEAFAAAIELYPKESEYQACYGYTLFKLNHPDRASKAAEGEKIVRQALSMNARNDKAHLFLGWIARVKGDNEEAKKHFEKALELQPDNIEAQRELRLMDSREAKKGGLGGLFRGKK